MIAVLLEKCYSKVTRTMEIAWDFIKRTLKDRSHFLSMVCAGIEIRCHSKLTGSLGTGPRSPGSMQEGTGTLQEG